jgi:hypothetical protein
MAFSFLFSFFEKTLQLYMNVNINALNILLNCSSAFSNPETLAGITNLVL